MKEGFADCRHRNIARVKEAGCAGAVPTRRFFVDGVVLKGAGERRWSKPDDKQKLWV